MKGYLWNGWNWIHLAGGIIGVQNSPILIGDSIILQVLLTLLLDVLKECGDWLSRAGQVEWMWKIGFDPAGFDIRDILMCCFGIIIGLGLEVLKWRL